MDGDGIFDDFDGKDSGPTSTAWSTRIAPESKGRKTFGAFGRRGSAPFSSIRDPFQKEEKERSYGASFDEDQNYDTELVENDWSMVTSPEPDIPMPPRRRSLSRRSNTISGDSPGNSRLNLPPMLIRSNSVSGVPKRRSSTSSRSFHSGSSYSSFGSEGRDFENFNPNFQGRSILPENTSPKRSAMPEGNKKGRKKIRPTTHSFMQSNDFSSLSKLGNNGGNMRGNGNGNKKLSTLDSFSDLARSHEENEPAWLTISTSSLPSSYEDVEEDMSRRRSYSTGFCATPTTHFLDDSLGLASSPTSTTSSRKRGASRSKFIDDDSPVVRSRSRLLSPFSSRTPELPCLTSIDSKPRSSAKRMNLSFFSSNTDANVVMSDDDALSRDSDSSIEMNDANESRATNRPACIRSTKFDPKKASVDDFLKRMPGFEDIEFLSKSLSQCSKGSRGLNIWRIALPMVWDKKRRDAFLHCAQMLGFTLKSGGGSFTLIHISSASGDAMIPLVKATLETYDERKRQSQFRTKPENAPKIFDFSPAVHSRLSRSTPKE